MPANFGTEGLAAGGLRNLRTGIEIPDSALYYWDPTEFASPWPDKVSGTDMTITGGLSSDTFADSSAAVSGDGVDDHGSAASTDIMSNAMSVELELQTTATGTEYAIGSNDGTNIFLIYLNEDGDFNSSGGELTCFVSDAGGGGALSFGYDLPFNDGAKHKASIIINDATTNDVEMIVDGTSVTPTTYRTNSPNLNVTLGQNPAYFAQNSSGSIQDHWSGKLGKIVHHDEAITGQTI